MHNASKYRNTELYVQAKYKHSSELVFGGQYIYKWTTSFWMIQLLTLHLHLLVLHIHFYNTEELILIYLLVVYKGIR